MTPCGPPSKYLDSQRLSLMMKSYRANTTRIDAALTGIHFNVDALSTPLRKSGPAR